MKKKYLQNLKAKQSKLIPKRKPARLKGKVMKAHLKASQKKR